MDGGDITIAEGSGISERLLALSLDDEDEPQVSGNLEKDPRKIARKYQLDLCKKALEENVVVYLETGCGKTHIAVLLIYEMGHLIKKPQKNICIFLAPTVALVQQQAKVIENSIDFKVGVYFGSSTHVKSLHYWQKEVEENEVLVMTPQILLHNLSHCFIKIERIALLIFDECHYAQLDSSHPYAEIMKIFYKTDAVKLPRIFGMTASPKSGKGGSIDGLEALLRAKVFTVEDKDELEKFVTSPKVNVYYYSSVDNGSFLPDMIYTRKLEEIKNQSMSALRINSVDQSILRNTKKLLQNLHCNLIFCLENLGLWGALQCTLNSLLVPLSNSDSENGYHGEKSHVEAYLHFLRFLHFGDVEDFLWVLLKKASYIFLKGDQYENADFVEEESSSDTNLCNKYLHQVLKVLASDCTRDGKEADLSCVEVLKEPYFSKKLLRLIGVLSSFRLQPNMKCIIFVHRIVTARSLTHILRNLKFLSAWKCGFLVGVHSGLVSRKNTSIILDKFRSGELNLLVATKVGEEGLDIQTCCLVIRFDLPETVSSFIQSRGRARMPQSEYAFLVDRGNPRERDLIEHFMKGEAQMNEEISVRKSSILTTNFEDRTYKVDSTGATISAVMSISLLHHYCAKLPHDEYFHPKPQFFYYDDTDGMVCTIILPANAPIHQIVGSPQSSTEASKKDACLRACKALHEIGALTDYLLPDQNDEHEELSQVVSDSDGSFEEDSRAELYEMLVPAALKKPWTEEGSSTYLSCYYIEIHPTPADREYRKFGLFMKEPLPEEAGKMKVELCLARGRMVKSQLIPCGVTRFQNDEIAAAEMFQQMSLQIILDRQKFVSEYVSLEKDDIRNSSSPTFYLLLPLGTIKHDRISVDWALIKRCLASPIFKHPRHGLGNQISESSKYLHLANGHFSIDDVVDSLVYVPCNNIFFFISAVYQEQNGYSLHSGSNNHVQHYKEKFNMDLAYPDQPLLKAKQLFVMDNLLRKKKSSEQWREKEEHFIEMPPELCQLKVLGFSKDIGSSLSLLPSIMYRLESFLVATELKDRFAESFPEGAEVTTLRVLEAITTERCCESFSLERLEVLGDAFLKFAVGRCLFLKHDALDEGQLTGKRSNIVNNSNLLKLATGRNLQVYVRDQSFEPGQFFAFGRPCPISCTRETQESIHSRNNFKNNDNNCGVICNKCHHWLYNKTIADVLEALTGAFIVDCGFKAATAFLNWVGITVDLTLPKIDDICSASEAFLPLSSQMDVKALESMLGYKFAHKGLLIQAFVHPSFNNLLGGCYQRLEFLGDAVLDYLITSYLFSVYPSLKPGHLTDLRSACVNNTSFADVAGKWSFHKFIICDSSVLREAIAKYINNIAKSGSVKDPIEEKTCPKVLGDLVESFTGALYLDTGFDLKRVWKTMLFLLDPIISIARLQSNPLREINELCQSYNWALQFSKSKKDNKFTVEAKVDEKNISASASATNVSGKAAKRAASRKLSECLKARGYKTKLASLEEVLAKTEVREAKLIGYDETPSSGAAKSDSPGILEDSDSDYIAKVYLIKDSSPVKFKPIPKIRDPPSHRKSPEASSSRSPSNSCRSDSSPSNDSNGKGAGPSTVLAKSRLYELCTANCWRPPIFECCQEMGPSHLKEFLFKVVLEMEEMPNEVFEFYGESRARKKDASETAAEAALWYLGKEGYVWDRKRDR